MNEKKIHILFFFSYSYSFFFSYSYSYSYSYSHILITTESTLREEIVLIAFFTVIMTATGQSE